LEINEDDLQENVAKLGKIGQAYDMTISNNKIQAVAMEGRYMRTVTIVIVG
jgi:hypothetical protein